MKKYCFLFVFMANFLLIAHAADGDAKHLKKLLRKDPKNIELNQKLGKHYYDLYKAEKRTKNRRKAISQYKKTAALVEGCDKSEAYLYELIAAEYWDKGGKKNLGDLRRLISRCPGIMSYDLAPPSMVEYYFLLKKAREKGQGNKLDTKVAVNLLQASIKESPKFIRAHLLLSFYYQQEKQGELALMVIRQAKKIDGDNPEVAWQLGELLLDEIESNNGCYVDRMGELDEAIAELKFAASEKYDKPGLHNTLSYGFRLKGLQELSLYESERAYELKNSLTNKDNLSASIIFQGQAEKAVSLYREVIIGASPEGDSEYDYINDELMLLKSFEYLGSHLADFYAISGQWQEANRILKHVMKYELEVGFYSFLRIANSELILNGAEKAASLVKKRFADVELAGHKKNLYRYYVGEMSEADLLAASENDCQLTEILYFIAAFNLSKGNKKVAKQLFKKVTELSTYGYYEHIGARLILKSL